MKPKPWLWEGRLVAKQAWRDCESLDTRWMRELSRTSFFGYAADAGALSNQSLKIRGKYGTLSTVFLTIHARGGSAGPNQFLKIRGAYEALSNQLFKARRLSRGHMKESEHPSSAYEKAVPNSRPENGTILGGQISVTRRRAVSLRDFAHHTLLSA